MKVIFMGRKPNSTRALEYLLEKKIEIAAVVATPKKEDAHWKETLWETAELYDIPILSEEKLYKDIDLKDIDLVISFLYWKKIKRPLIELPKIGCINFHPAPLPDFKGFAPYSFGIFEEVDKWGVTAHFVDESFDAGDIIKVKKFGINPKEINAFDLVEKSHYELFELFKEVIDDLLKENKLPRIPQEKGSYNSKEDFEKLRKIKPSDSYEEIERKIRAFWYPPFMGAEIKIQDKEYTIVDEKLLKKIGKKYHGKNDI